MLFCDGHVMWFGQEELAVNKEPTPVERDRENAKLRMWNNDHRAPGDR